MKILLIAPASGKWRHVGCHRLFNGKTFRFSLLSLLSVAAQSPADAEIRIVDEQGKFVSTPCEFRPMHIPIDGRDPAPKMESFDAGLCSR